MDIPIQTDRDQWTVRYRQPKGDTYGTIEFSIHGPSGHCYPKYPIKIHDPKVLEEIGIAAIQAAHNIRTLRAAKQIKAA